MSVSIVRRVFGALMVVLVTVTMLVAGRPAPARAFVFGPLELTNPSCTGVTVRFYYDGLPGNHADLSRQPDRFRVQVLGRLCSGPGCFPFPIAEHWQTTPPAFGYVTIPLAWPRGVIQGITLEVVVGQYDVSLPKPVLLGQELRASYQCGTSASLPTVPYSPAGFVIGCSANTLTVYRGPSPVLSASFTQIGGPLSLALQTGANQWVASAGGVSLWALRSNELQIHYDFSPDTTKLIVRSNICGTIPLIAQPVPAAPAPTAPVAGGGSGTVYVVQPGDNLFRIALRFGVSMDAIAQRNGITNYALIYAGQRLTIP